MLHSNNKSSSLAGYHLKLREDLLMCWCVLFLCVQIEVHCSELILLPGRRTRLLLIVLVTHDVFHVRITLTSLHTFYGTSCCGHTSLPSFRRENRKVQHGFGSLAY